MDRRKFLKAGSMAVASFTIVPSFVLGGKHIPPSDTLYMAGIGVGGRGGGVASELFASKAVKYVALCDVDERQAKDTFNKHKKAKKYQDFRELYDNHINDIDAVFVATPDHTHATIALPFMRAKKHAYVEKPLTHNIAEARLMTQTAAEMGIVTQMGNQGASSDGIRTAQEWINAGVIGTVHQVDCWTNRPVWPQGFRPDASGEVQIPKELNWDLWLGPAKARPYNENYLPFNWRGFWDFGTGALGDMGCHIMETPFKVLELKYPTKAEASCTTIWSGSFVEANYPDVCPPSSVVRLSFPAPKHGEVQLNWYDGGLMPPRPQLLPEDELPGDGGGGSIFYGQKGILITDTYSGNPRIYGLDREQITLPSEHIPRIKTSHAENFVLACLNGSKTSSPFQYAGPLTEAVLMGNLAIQSYQYKELKTGKKVGDWDPYQYPGRTILLWNGEQMKITNYDHANQWVNGTYREGWELTKNLVHSK